MIHVIVDTLSNGNFSINLHGMESVGHSYNCRERKKPSYYNDFEKVSMFKFTESFFFWRLKQYG